MLRKLKYFLYLGIAGYLIYLLVGSTDCSFPLKYRLNNLDSRFEISQEEVLTTIFSAEKIWEDAIGINLFEYNPKGQLKINFVFDERQQINIDTKKAEEKINQSESFLTDTLNQHESLSILYKQKLDSHNAIVINYEQQMDTYNQTVDYWNQRGGASPEVFEELSIKKTELKTIYDQLSTEEKELNTLRSQLNNLADLTNTTVKKHNANIETFNDRFGGSREFNQGDYFSKTINIYEFETTTDLKLVLAHEMGHALGLDHVDDPYALMYYLMEKQDINNIKLSEADIQAFDKKCSIK